MKSYSLAEVAEQVLPKHWTDSERWLRRRLNAGDLTGYRVGREWLMTDADIEGLVRRYRNAEPAKDLEPAPEPISFAAGLSAQSRRRLRSAS